MYRTRTGPYSIRKTNHLVSADLKKTKGKSKEKDKGKDEGKMISNKPRKDFGFALESVLTDLSASDLNKSSLINPPPTSDPLQDINDRIKEQCMAQDYYLTAMVSTYNGKAVKRSNTYEGDDNFTGMDSSFLHSSTQELQNDSLSNHLNNSSARKPYEQINNARLLQRVHPSVDNESVSGSRSRSKSSAALNRPSSKGTDIPDDYRETRSNTSHISYKSSNKDKYGDIENGLGSGLNAMYDDGLTVLTADEYVRIRLIPYLSTYAHTAPSYSKSLTIITCIVILLTIVSSIFSGFDLTSFIPLAISFGEALSSWESHKSIEIKLMLTNGARDQLNKVYIHTCVNNTHLKFLFYYIFYNVVDNLVEHSKYDRKACSIEQRGACVDD